MRLGQLALKNLLGMKLALELVLQVPNLHLSIAELSLELVH